MFEKILKILATITLVFIIIFFVWFTIAFINMMIDHQCYQLEPNENYTSTICEHYWNK